MDLRTFTEPQQGASYEQLLADAGITRVYLQVLDLNDLDHLEALQALLD